MLNGWKKHLVLFREFLPFTFIVLTWLIHVAQGFLQKSFIPYGLLPKTQSGLIGIITTPFIHADWSHLISNTLPLLVLGYLLYKFYREITFRVFVFLHLVAGMLMWAFIDGNAYHIGASGIVYGLASFLFLSGIIRRHPPLMVVSFIVVFLYGSMVWYMFPLEKGVSWEGHLFGALTGLMLAVVYRRRGPQRVRYAWENEDEEEQQPLDLQVIYEYRKKRDEEREMEKNHGPAENPETPTSPGPGICYHYREDK
ncbi:MAG: hypothetical protein FD123_2994 [Bacteroidetes bacterium]|nr:MAG: hypothetical protein FD123_2994 [Bacteroidota bacterium]